MASRSSSTGTHASSAHPSLSAQQTSMPLPREGNTEPKDNPRIAPQPLSASSASIQQPGLKTREPGGATSAPDSPRGNSHEPQPSSSAATSAPNSPRWNAATTPRGTLTSKVTLATRRASVSEEASIQPDAQAKPGRVDATVGSQRDEAPEKAGATGASRTTVNTHTPLSPPPSYADLYPSEDGSNSGSDSADGADSDSESRGMKRAPGGRDAPVLKDKPGKAARRADTLSPGQSRKDEHTEKQKSQDTWKARRPSSQNTQSSQFQHHRAKLASPRVPTLNLPGAQLGGADTATSGAASTSSTSSTSSASNISGTASASAPVFVSTATLLSGAPSSAVAPNLSPRKADGGEGGGASRRSGSPLHALAHPQGGRPQSPRSLMKITVTSAPKASNAADGAPGMGLRSSSGSQSSRTGPSPGTHADALGFDLRGVPDRYSQPVAMPSSPKPSGPRAPAPDDLETAIDKALAHADWVGRTLLQGKQGKEQNKGSH